MKFYIKILIVLLLLFAVALPLVLKRPNGEPVMAVGDWLPEGFNIQQALQPLLNQVMESTGEVSPEQLQQLAEDLAAEADQGAQSGAGGQTLDENAPVRLSSESRQMYKWQDAQGRWHFSSEKPLDSRNVSMEALPDVKNVMEAPKRESEDGLGGFDPSQLLEKVKQISDQSGQ